MSQFGNFHAFCRDSTLPVCNLFLGDERSRYGDAIDKACVLEGFAVSGGGRIRNLGSILVCAMAVIISVLLIWLSERKKAAVGRREIQIFLIAYVVVSIAEVFSVGGFLTDRKVLVWFSAIHIGAIAATCWILLINAIVGYQLMDDGTPASIGLTAGSGLVILVGAAYIGVDTGFEYSGEFTVTPNLRNYALYVLYLLFPLLLLVAFFILEAVLVLGVLRETRPMVLLSISAVLFVISQVFEFVISVHLCNATDGTIDGALFETLFVLLSVVTLWFFWSSITEDEWPDDNFEPSLDNMAARPANYGPSPDMRATNPRDLQPTLISGAQYP